MLGLLPRLQAGLGETAREARAGIRTRMDQGKNAAPTPVAEASKSELEDWSRGIADRIAAGDSAAEAEMARRFEAGLRMILRRTTGGDAAVVDDLIQETLIIVIQRLRREPLADPTRLAAFAAQTARNLAIAHRRKMGRQRTDTGAESLEYVSAEPRDSSEQLTEESNRWIVSRLLADLPQERDRIVLQRFYLQDHDRAVICRDLGLTETTFNQVLFRARNRLREIVTARGYDKRDLLMLALVSGVCVLSYLCV